MAVQARFYVAEISEYANQQMAGYAKPEPRGVVKLRPVSRGKANAQWASATPSGQIEMTVLNGPAYDWFRERLGSELAITFDDRPADELEHE